MPCNLTIGSPGDCATSSSTRCFRGLTRRERQIIELRFGLQDDRPRTLQEVSQKFGLSRERIRQIEAKTITRLRGCHETEHLREYLE